MSAHAEIIAELRRVLNERDEAREQLDLTKRELGRWVDREAKAVRERDEARAEVAGLADALDDIRHQRDRYHVELKQERAEVERLRAEADRWKRSCNVFRERDWPKAFQATVTSLEQEVSDAHEQLAKLRKLSKPWEGDAYRRGAEAMREACAREVVEGRQNSHEGVMQWLEDIASDLRDLPIPEEL